MPKFRITAPDGRTFIVNAPEGTTQKQAMAYARNQLGKKKAKPEGGALDWISKNVLSPLNEAAIGAAEGVYNAAAAVTDPLAGLIVGEDAVKQARQQRRGVADAATEALVSQRAPIAREAGRIGGAMAIPLPGKKLQEGNRLARTAYRAMQGAVGGAAARDVDEDAATPAAIGAAANVALPPALSWLGGTRPVQALSSAVTRALAPVLGREGAEAAAARPLAPLGRKAEATAERFRRVGVDEPTTGMVTRATEGQLFPAERKLAKVANAGEDLAAQIRKVETDLADSASNLVDRLGGAKGPEAVGRSAQEVLEAKSNEMQRVTSRLYDTVRDTRGDEVIGELSKSNLRQAFDDPELVDNPVFDSMTAAVGKRLARYAERDEGAIGITVRQAEELRKFIGNLGDARDPTTKMVRSRLINALDDDVVNAVGDEPFKVARDSARARFEEFKGTVAGRIADEGIPVEKLSQRILSMPLADLRAVKQSFLRGTDDQVERGSQAWADLGAQSVDDLLKSAISDEKGVMGGALLKSFRKQSAHLRELLSPADYKDLRRLVYASRDATKQPPSSSAYGSDTAPEIMNLINAAPAATKKGWTRLLGKLGLHGLAAAKLGPAGPMAVEAASVYSASAAQRKAAEALARRIELASNPQEYAAARAAAQRAAQGNPAVRGLLDEYGIAVGGAAAATAQ